MPDIVLGLDRITFLMKKLKNPQPKHVIHVAGTNGKGSVCAFIDSILRTAGYSTGRFVSPYFLTPRDSILINNEPVEEEEFQFNLKKVRLVDAEWTCKASEFELLTATAFLILNNHDLDVCIIEVGVGGRLDATNVIETPLVCAFSSIGMDHEKLLGPTLSNIAYQKAGIMKRDSIAISCEQAKEVDIVLKEQALETGIPIHFVYSEKNGEYSFLGNRIMVPELGLKGHFQHLNAAIAIASVERLIELGIVSVNQEQLMNGLLNTRWKGRLETVTLKIGPILVDGAHNLDSALCLRKYADSICMSHQQKVWIVAMKNDKPCEAILRVLIQPNDLVFASEFSERADMPWVKCHSANTILETALTLGAHSQSRAFHQWLDIHDWLLEHAQPNWLMIACGSLYFIADVYKYINC